MTFLDTQAPIKKIGPAIIAGIALFLVGALSVGKINVFGTHAGFGFLPLLVLAVWPRQAHALLSILVLFMAGIFTDWATGGIVGQWALVYTVIWAVVRPELRNSPYSIFSLLVFWVATCGLAIVLIGISGWFVFRVSPDFGSFGRQAAVATAVLPVVILLRAVLSKRISDQEEWGR